ncbi:MAG: tetratricopeptide repeat protein [Candidatus Omnitrophota bacterium]
MNKSLYNKAVIYVISFGLIGLFSASNVLAEVRLADEAISYRKLGYEAQQKGDIDAAIQWYQKAANLDLSYPAPHNDLGILYEAKDSLDRAEASYKKALAISPDYEKAHTNLALLYERKGEKEKAAFHWIKRYKLGDPNSPWTKEAEKRLQALGLLAKVELEKKAEAIEKARKEALKKDGKEKIEEELDLSETPEPEEGKSGWTRLGKKKDEKKAEEITLTKKKDIERKRKKKAPEMEEEASLDDPKLSPKQKLALKKKALRAKRKREQSEDVIYEESAKEEPTSSEWTKMRKSSPRKATPKTIKKSTKKDVDKELERSLKLAEARLKKGKGAYTKKSNYKEKVFDSGARSYYLNARNYYKNGEHAKALTTIRTARKNYPEDASLMELEKSIKNKMKEERIADHYKEGMMHYRQNDYERARKEFESMLTIVPE